MEWSIGKVLGDSFAVWKKRWGLLALVTLFYLILPFFPHYLQNHVSEEAVLIRFWLFVIGFVIQLLAAMGLNTIALKAAKGEEYLFSDFFSKFHLFPSYFTASVLYALAVLLGTLLLIVPGIYFGMKYSLANFYVLDQECKGVEALKKSALATYGSKWRLFAFSLLCLLFNGIAVCTFGIGLLFTIPFLVIAWAHIYYLLRTV